MSDTCVRIVEDSPVLADLIGVTLEFKGIQFCKTTDNFELLLGPSLWEGVTAAICDLNLGGFVTGQMILHYLRQNHPSIKRVVLSGTAGVRSDLTVALADVVLTKPSNLEEIAGAVG